MIDLAYPLGSGSRWHNNEIRYSLRSAERHIPDLGRVFVIGAKLPPFLSRARVVHVQCRDTRGFRTLNTLAKCLALCNHQKCPAEFVWMNDDITFLGPYDLRVHHHRGPMQTPDGANEYHRAKRNTIALYQRPPLSFETHRPILIMRDVFREIMPGLLQRHQPIMWQTVYCEHAATLAVHSTDAKVYTADEFLSRVGSMDIVSTDNAVVRDNRVRQWFADRFPEPSRFEYGHALEAESRDIHRRRAV